VLYASSQDRIDMSSFSLSADIVLLGRATCELPCCVTTRVKPRPRGRTEYLRWVTRKKARGRSDRSRSTEGLTEMRSDEGWWVVRKSSRASVSRLSASGKVPQEIDDVAHLHLAFSSSFSRRDPAITRRPDEIPAAAEPHYDDTAPTYQLNAMLPVV
jgi:hypothetical protein